ncbi:MAG: hypothetical protein RIR70_991 [Pseudomonadota bacterium]|jgi:hypothetical protein
MTSPHSALSVLGDARRSGIFNLPAQGSAPLIKAAQDLGFAIFHISLEGVRDKDAFLDRIAQGMGFPEWFGANWDALSDCLADLSWVEGEGYLVLLENCADFVANAQADFLVAADIFNTTAALWREDGRSFWVFADLHPNGLAILPSLT